MGELRLAERLHATAIRLLRRVRGEDAAAGLSAARLSALSVLVFGGTRTVTELAEAEQVTLPTMTRLLQGMERDGLVRRRRDRGDARVVRVSATAAGRRAMEAARDRRVEHLDGLLRRLSAADARRVEAAVTVLESVLEATPGAAPPAVSSRTGARRRGG